MRSDVRTTEEVESFLRIRGLTKAFPGVRALDDVDLDLKPGEVHVLIGENGAGKSTLMKLVAGLECPDSGEISKQGRVLRMRNPHDAIRLGIAMIHQELMPFRQMTVAENILIGQEPVQFGVWIDRKGLLQGAARVLGRLKCAISPERLLGELSLAEMQLVEIARALAQDADVIVMDEPTSSLSKTEVAALFEVIRDLQQRGATILYTSHKMEEVFEIGDRVTVLRDGRRVTTLKVDDASEEELIQAMVGRELTLVSSRAKGRGAGPLLTVHNLSRKGGFEKLSFQVNAGEILGFAGLMGAGRTAVVNALFGLEPADRGEIQIGDRRLRIRCPQDAIRHGIGLVSEDRRRLGLVPQMSVRSNLTLANLKAYSRRGFVDVAAESRITAEQVHSLGIKSAGQEQPVAFLSGGNQQKVVLSRMLLICPSVLLLDEPTRGIDVGAKSEIHGLIRKLASDGLGVLLVSSELPELLALSDRLLVMRNGRLVAELDPERTSQEEVMGHAMLR
ncbi:MAG: sugar ABC transporter ATP-binding protein [Acidobacteriota bacterium]|nr:MAG: sugar ABC transporter ATP-binding protein [Acidobacteriota bacterium]